MISGMEKGVSQPLEVVESPPRGRGVFSLAPIARGSYVTDYKYHAIYPARKKAERNRAYDSNDEGFYIMECVVNGRKMCLDATRRIGSCGRSVIVN